MASPRVGRAIILVVCVLACTTFLLGFQSMSFMFFKIFVSLLGVCALLAPVLLWTCQLERKRYYRSLKNRTENNNHVRQSRTYYS